jgi:hypothetical protein
MSKNVLANFKLPAENSGIEPHPIKTDSELSKPLLTQ